MVCGLPRITRKTTKAAGDRLRKICCGDLKLSKRKAISTRTRFEIFKRDRFACQYCGRTPPEVVLHVDHIVPVCSGGGNEEGNLVTACENCNFGKSGVDLGDVRPVPNFDIEQQREKLEQLTQMNRFLAARRRKESNAVQRIGRHWFNQILDEDERDTLVFASRGEVTIRTFLKHLPEIKIIEAIDIAQQRKPPRLHYHVLSAREHPDAWRYFCGICWNMIKEGQRG